MVVAKSTEPENLRIRLDADVKKAWDELLRRRKISQQAAVAEMVSWVLGLEPLHQAIIFNQMEESDRADIARLLLQRMADNESNGTFSRVRKPRPSAE